MQEAYKELEESGELAQLHQTWLAKIKGGK